MKKLLLLYLTMSDALGAQDSFPELFKDSWKKDFKTRNEFVKNLQENKKQSVRSWALGITRAQEERIIDTIIRDMQESKSVKDDLKYRFKELSKYDVQQIGRLQNIQYESAYTPEIKAAIHEVLPLCGRDITLTVTANMPNTIRTGADQATEKKVTLYLSGDETAGMIAHEAGHLACNHVLINKMLSDHGITGAHHQKNLLRKQQEFTADIFAATISKEYAQERVNRMNDLSPLEDVLANPAYPSVSERLAVAQEIYKLLEAEEQYLKTHKISNKDNHDQAAYSTPFGHLWYSGTGLIS